MATPVQTLESIGRKVGTPLPGNAWSPPAIAELLQRVDTLLHGRRAI